MARATTSRKDDIATDARRRQPESPARRDADTDSASADPKPHRTCSDGTKVVDTSGDDG